MIVSAYRTNENRISCQIYDTGFIDECVKVYLRLYSNETLQIVRLVHVGSFRGVRVYVSQVWGSRQSQYECEDV